MALSISNTYTNKTSTPMSNPKKGALPAPVWGFGNDAIYTGGVPQATKPQTTFSAIPKTAPVLAAPRTTSPATGGGVKGVMSTPSGMQPPATTYAAPTSPSPVKGVLQPPTSTKATTPTTPFGSAITGLMGSTGKSKDQKKSMDAISAAGARSNELGANAQALANKYGSEISRVGQLGAGAVAGDLSTGTNVVGSGNAAIASQSASSRMNALAQGLEAELAGNQQALAGNEQALTGANYNLAGANAQQQLAQQGFGSVATYSQPSPAGYGQTVFDPVTGSFSGGSDGLNPQLVASQLADAVRSGRMTYEQAVQSLGYAGGAGQQFLNGALGNGFNIPASTATISGQTGVLSQLPLLQSADVAAEGVKNKVITYLADNPQLNPSTIAKANVLQQWVQGKQLSDPKYQTLFNYLNEYTNTLAPILGVGGDPTNLKTEIAQSFIDAASSGKTIAEVLENIQGLSRGKIQDIQSGAMGGGVVSAPYSTGSSSGGGGKFSF